MLTGGGHGGPSAALGPDSAELGVQGKAALVSKNQQGLLALFYDSVEFFLSPRRKRATPLVLA